MFDESGRPGCTAIRRTARRSPPVVLALVCLGAVMLCAAVSAGCGQAPESAAVVATDDGPSSVSVTTVIASPSTVTIPFDSAVSASPDPSTATARAFPQVFTDLARALAPLPVYGLAELPAGCTVPEEWWPVIEVSSAEEYQGPVRSNPRLAYAGEDYGEGQLVLEMEAGTALLFQNFRGDVGLTPGEKVGEVEGNTAILYEINEGLLVQWSVEGMWYGVFARGLLADEVVALALALKRVPSEETD